MMSFLCILIDSLLPSFLGEVIDLSFTITVSEDDATSSSGWGRAKRGRNPIEIHSLNASLRSPIPSASSSNKRGTPLSGIAKGPERTMRNVFQQNSVGEPLRRRLRIGLSPRELEADAQAEAEGASPSVEPSGGSLRERLSFNATACQNSRRRNESSTFVVQASRPICIFSAHS